MFRATMQLLEILEDKRVEEPTISATVFSVFDSKLSLGIKHRKNFTNVSKLATHHRETLKTLNFAELSTFI